MLDIGPQRLSTRHVQSAPAGAEKAVLIPQREHPEVFAQFFLAHTGARSEPQEQQ